jgi:hypothetical protein
MDRVREQPAQQDKKPAGEETKPKPPAQPGKDVPQ